MPGTARYILPNIIGFLFVVVGVGLATAAGLQLLIGFEPSRGLHGLSTLLPIGWSASKVVFFIMPYSYFVVGMAGSVLLLLIRYLGFRVAEG